MTLNALDNYDHITEALRKLLLASSMTTQEDLVETLIKQGYDVNQSKISRLLRKLGATKAKNKEGEFVYCLPKEPAPPTASTLKNLIIDIVANETTVVIHTSPGSASLIARLLDHTEANILGTVAGDDTIMIIPESVKHTQKTLNTIKKMLA